MIKPNPKPPSPRRPKPLAKPPALKPQPEKKHQPREEAKPTQEQFLQEEPKSPEESMVLHPRPTSKGRPPAKRTSLTRVDTQQEMKPLTGPVTPPTEVRLAPIRSEPILLSTTQVARHPASATNDVPRPETFTLEQVYQLRDRYVTAALEVLAEVSTAKSVSPDQLKTLADNLKLDSTALKSMSSAGTASWIKADGTLDSDAIHTVFTMHYPDDLAQQICGVKGYKVVPVKALESDMAERLGDVLPLVQGLKEFTDVKQLYKKPKSDPKKKPTQAKITMPQENTTTSSLSAKIKKLISPRQAGRGQDSITTSTTTGPDLPRSDTGGTTTLITTMVVNDQGPRKLGKRPPEIGRAHV